MDIIKLRKQLEIDEGIKHEVYLDHLGLATFGIGHLVLNSDPEYGAEVGTPVSEERVIEIQVQKTSSAVEIEEMMAEAEEEVLSACSTHFA